jgi:hypothetical protein
MSQTIFSNSENWNKPVGKLILKFEQFYSDVAEIEDDSEIKNRDALIELRDKAYRYLTYLNNFIDQYPPNMREIKDNPNLKEEYSYNSAENLRTKLQGLIDKIISKINDLSNNQNGGVRRHKRTSRRHKRTSRRHKRISRRHKRISRRHK